MPTKVFHISRWHRFCRNLPGLVRGHSRLCLPCDRWRPMGPKSPLSAEFSMEVLVNSRILWTHKKWRRIERTSDILFRWFFSVDLSWLKFWASWRAGFGAFFCDESRPSGFWMESILDQQLPFADKQRWMCHERDGSFQNTGMKSLKLIFRV